MSWPERGRVFADHFSATSHAGGQADQSHEVRHAARHRHRPQIQRLQAGRVTPCAQTSRSAEGHAASAFARTVNETNRHGRAPTRSKRNLEA
jgi:hypothetical protein